jgi:predicted GNAT family acetyltransferase
MDVLHDNTDDSQYEMDVDGQTVFARYRKSREALTILWVEAPEQLRGTGAAGRLMSLIAAEARAQSWNIIPVCGYAAAWLKRSDDYRDLIAS